ncbi:MAG: glycerol-3-phosphate dehydrogenase/oxidase [Chloroflexia bacterium]|nr:glycerol-3-phosphate dehydrogenase/oxidase [Chloroflexia bacterium]
MWHHDWRNQLWPTLPQAWELIIVGGGITGAGILREATRLGLRALLVEQRDFAWGTSSRSSKMVHGGLRYLREGKLRLTRSSVRERQRLLEEGPGLIDPLGFLIASYEGDRPGRWLFSAGLTLYDLLALQWSHRRYRPEDLLRLAPHIVRQGLVCGFRYDDAQTDDARLVLRLVREAVAAGGTALNYARAESLLLREGQVRGIRLRDQIADRSLELSAGVVINATGAWADRLRAQVEAPPRLRPLRGSHLVFAAERLPVAQAITFLHPLDARPVFLFPWEGITLVGTTDLDHEQPLDQEPAISPGEVSYLMAAVESQCPSLGLRLDDVQATFAGVRPVIGTGKLDPSKESRDHVVWDERGLLTVTGGKLTTFRRIALDALQAVRQRLPALPPLADDLPVLNPVDVALPGAEALEERQRRYLLGRYGAEAAALVAAARPGELEPIPGTRALWAELRWAARAEGVVRLEDLLLRRVRLGLLLPQGARELLPRIRQICQTELGWDDGRWEAEEAAYLELWNCCYGPPEAGTVADWEPALVRAGEECRPAPLPRRPSCWAGLLSLGLLILFLWRRRRKQARR